MGGPSKGGEKKTTGAAADPAKAETNLALFSKAGNKKNGGHNTKPKPEKATKTSEEMEQPGVADLRTAFHTLKTGLGPAVNRLRILKKTPHAAGNTSRSPAKGKDTSSTRESVPSVLAQYRSIAQTRARNDELWAELNAANTALTAAQEGEQVAKAALAAAQKSEHDAMAALASSQENDQAAKTALSALQAQTVQLQAKVDGAKAKLIEAEAAVKEEKAASLSSMEEMLY
ncbi:uncharacterized protein LOC133796043 [Humulus lupulus]|uniref:uncharacterized protein LOC133796043 n=1 Tax=Humulus lupulus TaxID=3486 RepID=UPI002B415F10|nr:uncharacterized protein LOC133796043 [Humulus lupulus]